MATFYPILTKVVKFRQKWYYLDKIRRVFKVNEPVSRGAATSLIEHIASFVYSFFAGAYRCIQELPGVEPCVSAIYNFACSLLGQKRATDTKPQKRVTPSRFSELDVEDQELKCFKKVFENHSLLVCWLQNFPTTFYEEKGHERAKKVFKKVLAHQNLTVDFVSAPTDWDHRKPTQPLDPNIFHWSITQGEGVTKDIPRASKDHKRVHLFSVASQYNGAEAANPFTPQVGEAIEKSEWDHTQGPLAQRTNPSIFECVNAFLANLGFCMLTNVSPSAGKTYEKGSPIEHGYLRPSDENVECLKKEMEENFCKIELPCYESQVTQNGESVFLILGAAPAFGYVSGPTNSPAHNTLLYYAYLGAFLAQFNQVQTLLQRNPDKEIVFHVTGTGLGVFGGNKTIFKEAFLKGASWFQESLSEKDKKRVHVQLESYQNDFGESDTLSEIAQGLMLGAAKPRIE